jgi:serine/threonine protein kinase
MSMALEVIHSENIAHRDLKTDYIVLVMRFRSAVLLVLAALAIATGFHAQR